ncbi:hypothetical protein PMIN06_013112, partial [Paraphaeosphaeria minitans]
MAEVQLVDRASWPYWFVQLQFQANSKGIWNQINPEAIDAPAIDHAKPERPPLPQKPSPIADTASVASIQSYKAELAEYEMDKESFPLRIAEYRAAVSDWQADYTKIQNLWTWVNATVSPDLLAPAMITLVNTRQTTLQSLIRLLKEDLAPNEGATQNNVRALYRAHLEKAKQARQSPETWFKEWQLLYRKAKTYSISEISGPLATRDFLDAIAARIAPDWARSMNQQLIQDETLGRNQITLDDLGKVFSALVQEHSIRSSSNKTSGVFATFNGSSRQSTNSDSSGSSNQTKKQPNCPCKPYAHRWKPMECRRLQTAIAGSPQDGTSSFNLTDKEKSEILDRLKQPKWSNLRDAITKAEWNKKQSSTKTIEYPGSIAAALLNPFDLPTDNGASGVYSTLHSDAHPLSECTILDSAAAVHLVNDRERLVPGTFRSSNESVEA